MCQLDRMDMGQKRDCVLTIAGGIGTKAFQKRDGKWMDML